MATSIQHDLVSAVEHEISCPICFEDFEEPKSLPNCAHNVCQHCLEGMVKKRTNAIECPVCRIESVIPQGGVAAFPKNHLLVRLIEQSPGRKEKHSLKQALKNCKEKLEGTKAALGELEGRYIKTNVQDEKTKERIQSLTEKVVKTVRDHERKLLDEIQSRQDRNKETVESHKSSAAELFENANGCIQTVQEILENGELSDLTNLKDALLEKLNDFSKCLEERELGVNRKFTQPSVVSLTETNSVEKFIEDECPLGKLNIDTGLNEASSPRDIPTTSAMSASEAAPATPKKRDHSTQAPLATGSDERQGETHISPDERQLYSQAINDSATSQDIPTFSALSALEATPATPRRRDHSTQAPLVVGSNERQGETHIRPGVAAAPPANPPHMPMLCSQAINEAATSQDIPTTLAMSAQEAPPFTPRRRDFKICGSLIWTINGSSCGIANFTPNSVAASRNSEHFVALDDFTNHVYIFDEEGEVLDKIHIKFGNLWDIAVSNNEEIVVVNHERNRLLHYDMNGNFQKKFVTDPEDFVMFCSCTVDVHGRYIVTSRPESWEDEDDPHTMPCVLVYTPSGNLSFSFGEHNLHCPRKAVFLNGKFYVTDSYFQYVFMFDKNGIFVDTFGDDELDTPFGIAADYSSGNLVVTDKGNYSVHIYSRHGEQLECFEMEHAPIEVALYNNYNNLLICCEIDDDRTYIQMLTYL